MYDKIELPNGLKVVTEYLPHVHSVSVGVWVKVGSRQENENCLGVAHFIEHMLFKGTTTRSAKKIAEEIEAVGGQLNAFTSKEYTCFYAKVLDTDFALACDLLADMLLNSCFDQGEIEKEKKVILEEIKMFEDNPEEMVHDLLTDVMLPHHPLGRPILGTEKTVNFIEKERLLEFMADYYLPDNAVIAVVGNIRSEQVFREIENKFGAWSGRAKKTPAIIPYITAGSYTRKKKIEQAHLCLGFPGAKRQDDERYTFAVLDLILGGGVSSRLFQNLREERGLVYSTYTTHSAYNECGIFSIYAGTSVTNLEQVLLLIRQNLKAITSQEVDDKEIQRAKQQLRANLLLSLENTSTRMNRLAKNELFYGRNITPEEIVEKIEKVQKEDIRDMANKYLNQEALTTVIVGPIP